MGNITINELPTASTIDATQDLLPIYTASVAATQSITRNAYLGLASAPVGLTDTQTLTNKTLTSPTIASPTFSGTLAGTYTIGGTPTFPSSVAQLTATQTLTNKTLTSPTINSPTITNATITADTLAGYTTSNNGTVYGMSVSGGVLASAALANSVNTAAIQAGAVTSTQIAGATITPANLATHIAAGSFTPSGTGNLSVTGVGFKPQIVYFTLLVSTATGTTYQGTGVMTPTYQFTQATYTNSGSGGTRYASTSACISGVTGTTTPTQLATYVSMDANGFTVNFSASLAYPVGWEAWG